MRLLTLNIRHGGGTRASRIAEFICDQAPDIVVITEFRANAPGQAIRLALSQSGLPNQVASSTEPRVNAVCIASRERLSVIDLPAGPQDEIHRLLAVRTGGVVLVGAYFPQNEAKRPVFMRVRDQVLPMLGGRGIILGDLNTGRPFEDEAGSTFYCADCFDELLAAGLVDSWRVRNRTAREFSWYSRTNNGFRIDHALCTPDFDASIRSVRYLPVPRLQGTTDHSALVVESDG